MLHEVPADEVVLVADSGRAHVVGCQEEARHLEATSREHVGRRRGRQAVAGERLHVDALQRGAVGRECKAGHVGVVAGGQSVDVDLIARVLPIARNRRAAVRGRGVH